MKLQIAALAAAATVLAAPCANGEVQHAKRQLRFVPPHDTCANALDIAPGQAIASNTIGATPELKTFGLGSVFPDGPGVWFKFIGTGSAMHIYLSCEESWDVLVKVFRAESCDDNGLCEGGQDYACNDALQPLQTELGTNYWIWVSNLSPDVSGEFEISMVEDDNLYIHCDDDEYVGASCTGSDICRDFLRTCKNPDGTVFPHYGSCQCQYGSFRCYGRGCPEYHIPPANDDCVDAETLSVGEWVPGTTRGASVSPNMFGWGIDTLGPAVWYTFIGTGDTLELTMLCSDLHINAGARVVSGTCTSYGGEYHGRGLMCDAGASISNIETRPNQRYIVLIEGGDYTCVGTDCGPVRLPTGSFGIRLSRV